jgi:hypothetical protein
MPERALSRLLALKIALTLAVWCVPLLLFPPGWLAALGFPLPEPLLFLRLLGMAYLALVLGYAFGLGAARRGTYPAAVVWVGIVSNGGACLLLALAALAGTWASWGAIAPALMWASLFGTGAIAAGLVWLGPMRRATPRSRAR